jgi:hypothetical protein
MLLNPTITIKYISGLVLGSRADLSRTCAPLTFRYFYLLSFRLYCNCNRDSNRRMAICVKVTPRNKKFIRQINNHSVERVRLKIIK